MAAKKAAKRASLDDLLGKKPRTQEVRVGDTTVLFTAVGAKAYDDLLAAHPSESDDGGWDPESFPPALIAASATEPKLTSDQAKQLWESPSWSRGELMGVFTSVLKLNVEGLDVPFGDSV